MNLKFRESFYFVWLIAGFTKSEQSHKDAVSCICLFQPSIPAIDSLTNVHSYCCLADSNMAAEMACHLV